ncbi:MAG: DUF480 domain-containing protein [Opitutaceae bacterium]|nr:DUF480 domain-containing protein [Opitutaceae bacterium]
MDASLSVSLSPAPLVPPLSPLEARVLGSLIEKQSSTPDLYPLTLNSLIAACNQRSNRDPVLSVAAPEVEAALAGLRSRKLATVFAGAEARVAKHKHTLDLVFPLEPVARALLAELLLRGPQTGAALRANAARLCEMPDAAEIERLLNELAGRPAGGLVHLLPRQPGQKEARWAQRLAEETATTEGATTPLTVALALPPEVEQRFSALEGEVAALRAELATLRRALGES